MESILQVTKFWADTPKKGTTPKLIFSEFTDSDKQIVCIGVIEPAEFRYGPIFELRLLLSCDFAYFVKRLEKI